MENVFLAQAFDLGDPWPNINCLKDGCCPRNYNETKCVFHTRGNTSLCDNFCESYTDTR